ncbi:MAG: hypothetical protein K0Q74_1177 [Gammaproteobacteria bacterium]|nr:hypothetical protein [Gammaproteobacteria bacterium]
MFFNETSMAEEKFLSSIDAISTPEHEDADQARRISTHKETHHANTSPTPTRTCKR